jgi:hypothetical protein
MSSGHKISGDDHAKSDISGSFFFSFIYIMTLILANLNLKKRKTVMHCERFVNTLSEGFGCNVLSKHCRHAPSGHELGLSPYHFAPLNLFMLGHGRPHLFYGPMTCFLIRRRSSSLNVTTSVS